MEVVLKRDIVSLKGEIVLENPLSSFTLQRFQHITQQ